jgi:4-alpha-glucanotransferase
LNLSSQELLLIQDLPIGVNPAGADAWAWQDLLAQEIAVGAPPDEFNTQGQNWGLPPLIPHRLRAAAYEPFRQTIQANLQPGGGLRIDHVMGLFRLYWIPKQFPPGQGAYVRYPADDLLAILALESHRAKAIVIGEDLGTVEPEMREALAAHDILSYRVLWFESRAPSQYPAQALASVTTHDLPTIAGLWTNHDLEVQQKLNLQPNVIGFRRTRQKLARLTGLPPSAPVSQVIRRTHQCLAQAPSTLLAATLEDALAVQERPNYPGTTRHWPNWSIPLPYTLEQIQRQRLVRSVAQAFKNRSGQKSAS